MTTKMVDGYWTSPEVASFSGAQIGLGDIYWVSTDIVDLP